MKNLAIILILASATLCFGQSNDSAKKKRLTISDIKRSFPYNETETIKLVSFKYKYGIPEPESDSIDVIVPAYQPEIPKTDGTIDMAKMFEVRTLDNKVAEEILKILMNYDNKDGLDEGALCYDPRNGIVFFNKEDTVIGYIEICFACLQYKVEPKTVTVATFYREKFEVLKDIFREAGIYYGTTVRSKD